eukprot:CAMPEP_0168350170 /NCGR_PEP_ID=MMETSP0213-20121227/20934_1 /TAXON_ID=151035 /ORGANISM="Euplotes harpa, Strain FSP1.4" /LENGTH=70 /DNA_ID=CAMNT_0008360415 /DNA_START=32 /DNA_END=244 /DNA_ORIENTATION=+
MKSITQNPDINVQLLPRSLRACFNGDRNYRIVYSKISSNGKDDPNDNKLTVPLESGSKHKGVTIGYALYK